jgi:hypothetical protein
MLRLRGFYATAPASVLAPPRSADGLPMRFERAVGIQLNRLIFSYLETESSRDDPLS